MRCKHSTGSTGRTTGNRHYRSLQVQLADPLPYHLDETEPSESRNLDPRGHDWQAVRAACACLATVTFDRVCEMDEDRSDDGGLER